MATATHQVVARPSADRVPVVPDLRPQRPLEPLHLLQLAQDLLHQGRRRLELLPDAPRPVVEVGRADQRQQQLDALPRDAGRPGALDGCDGLGDLWWWGGGGRGRVGVEVWHQACALLTAAGGVLAALHSAPELCQLLEQPTTHLTLRCGRNVDYLLIRRCSGHNHTSCRLCCCQRSPSTSAAACGSHSCVLKTHRGGLHVIFSFLLLDYGKL